MHKNWLHRIETYHSIAHVFMGIKNRNKRDHTNDYTKPFMLSTCALNALWFQRYSCCHKNKKKQTLRNVDQEKRMFCVCVWIGESVNFRQIHKKEIDSVWRLMEHMHLKIALRGIAWCSAAYGALHLLFKTHQIHFFESLFQFDDNSNLCPWKPKFSLTLKYTKTMVEKNTMKYLLSVSENYRRFRSAKMLMNFF